MLGLAASLLFRSWHNGTGANEDDSKTSKVLFFISGDAIVMVVCLCEELKLIYEKTIICFA